MGWMKLSGFDGVLVDWYGVNKHYDYPMMHTRTQAIFEAATRANLNIGVVYEDQSLGFPMQNKLITAQDFPSEVQEVGAFLASDWLKRPNWIKIQGKPAVFNFGPNGFAAKDWQTFRAATGAIQLITLWNRTGDGGFDWPIPLEGIAPQLDFKNRSKSWGIKVSCAFPRFMDYYLAGGEKTGYTRVPDREGKTYRTTLEEAIKPGVDAIQVATWNDWQEGTQIEPSIEFGYRDLIETQKARKRLDSSFRYDPNDLSLPLQIYLARRSGKDRGVLKKANDALFAGNLASSRKFLTMIQNKQ